MPALSEPSSAPAPAPLAAPGIPHSSHTQGLPGWMHLLLAAACGLIVANLYYAQPLIGPMADSLGLSRAAAGLVVTLTQVGYGLGLLFIVPLSDLLENRRLIALSLVGTAVALLAVALSERSSALLVASLCLGFGAVAAQIILPFAAHFTPEAQRGRVVGNVMSGLLLGIMLARPLSSVLADRWGWHAVFYLSSVATLLVAGLLAWLLPIRQPAVPSSYGQLLRSMVQLLRQTPLLRLRGAYQACAFGAFSLFWTVVPLHLAAAPYHFSQTQIALFALAGVAGAVAAPVSGRLADRGWAEWLTPLSLLLVGLGLGLCLLPDALRLPAGGAGAVALLVAGAVVLDMGVTSSLLVGQRAIFGLGAAVRGRLNGLFMAMFFAGGALGSSLGVWVYAHGAWSGAVGLGLLLVVLALCRWALARRA